MTKKLVSLMFVVATFLALAVPVSAQGVAYIPQTPEGWYYRIVGNQVQMLAADNLGMVRGLTNQLRRAKFRSLADDLRWNGTAYGINTGRGFYSMYDRNMRPMGRREATITGAAIGAGIGYAVSGNSRGTAIGAVGGVIVGLFTRRGKNNNQRNDVIVTPPPQDQQGVYVGSDRIPVAVGTRPSGSTSGGFWSVGSTSGGRLNCMEQGMFTLENQSAGPLRVYKNTEPFEVIMPKGQMCAPLDGNYTGEVMATVVGRDGLTGRVGVAPAKPESRPGLVLVWR